MCLLKCNAYARIMRLMDKSISSSKSIMQENQGAPFVYELTSKGGKDQRAMTKHSRGSIRKDRSSYDKCWGLILPASNFWYVRASDPDGWT